MSAVEERRLLASLRQIHTNLGHPSNHAPASAIRVTGGSTDAVRAAMQQRGHVCETHKHLVPRLLARIRTERDLGDHVRACRSRWKSGELPEYVRLCERIKCRHEDSQKTPESHSIWRATMVDFRPRTSNLNVSSGRISKTWVANLCQELPIPNYRSKKTHARPLIDEFSIKFVADQLHRVLWLTDAVASACNAAMDDGGCQRSGFSAELRLPYTLPVMRDRALSERIAIARSIDDSKAQQRPCPTRHSIGAAATWLGARCAEAPPH